MRIVCDTNLWYLTLQKSFKGMNLTATYISMHEFATTGQLLTNIEKPRAAIQRMIQTSETIIYLEPFRFIEGKENPVSSLNTPIQLLRFLDLISIGENIKEEDRNPFEEWRQGREALVQSFADRINSFLPDIRSHLADTDHEEYIERSLSNPNAFRSLICRWTSDVVGHTINVESVDWDELHLFDTVGRKFFLKLETSQGRMFRKNDFFDLFNLVYVSPRDMYWVPRDPYFKNLIEESGLGHYLFNR